VSEHDSRRVFDAVETFIEGLLEAGCPIYNLTLPQSVWGEVLEVWCRKWSAEWRDNPPKSIDISCCTVRGETSQDSPTCVDCGDAFRPATRCTMCR
jgi:hypothetical protein